MLLQSLYMRVLMIENRFGSSEPPEGVLIEDLPKLDWKESMRIKPLSYETLIL